MATKPKSTAVAVKPKASAGNIVSVQAQLAAMVAAQAGKTEGGAKKVKLDASTFTLPNGSMFQAPVRAIVLDFNTQHSLYEKAYKKGEISPVICAALGDNPREMKPYDSIAAPQNGDCGSCWANEFKSANGGQGNGKACKQVRTMAMLFEGADGTIDPKGPIHLMQTNVTANKVFDAFVKSVASVFQMPPIGVVVSLGIDNSNPTWNFATYNDPVPNPDVAACMGRLAEARGLLEEQMTVSEPTPEPVKVSTPVSRKPVAARR